VVGVRPEGNAGRAAGRFRDTNYKWVALSNTTLGMLAATVNGSIVIISLPAIFRGIHLDPLQPSNVSYLLWMLMGYLVVSAVLVVTLGRLGDIYGRVRMYNMGFAIFSMAIALLVIAAGASALRGGRYVHDEQAADAGPGGTAAAATRQAAVDPIGEPDAAGPNGAKGAAGPKSANGAGQDGRPATWAGRSRATPDR